MEFKRIVNVEEILHFVVGDAAVDDSFLARVDNYERQLVKIKNDFNILKSIRMLL